MNNLIVVDSHCDTILKLTDKKADSLYHNNLHVDIKRMQNYPQFLQFFAVFIAPEYCPAQAYTRAMAGINTFKAQLAENPQHITHTTTYTHIQEAFAQNKIAAFLTIENGAALEGDLEKLQEFYHLGVRSMSLTWNGSNQLACGVGGDNLPHGLTPFGRQVVEKMNQLGMIIDLSHINEAGFWDVMETTTKPVMASHSNSKKICDHVRNLTDQQFAALIKNGGVAGINLCPPFLHASGKASITHVLRHIEHFSALGGEDHIGIGADFDGIASTPTDIPGVEAIGNIFEALLQHNYTETQVRKIAGLNTLRLIQNI